jgi:hypothetical protein
MCKAKKAHHLEIDQLRADLERVTKERDEARDKWDGTINEIWTSDLQGKIAGLTKERDEAKAAHSRTDCELDGVKADLIKCQKERYIEKSRSEAHYENYLQMLRKIEQMGDELNASRAEIQKCKDIWHVAENELWTGDLRDQITKARAQRDRAMEFARHRRDCDQMQNSDCKCSCGLALIEEEIAKEKEGK